MSGQNANAMSMLNQPASQIAKEGFPKFMQLPFELRSMIWKEAMPPYGFFTVLMLGREEPMPQQPPAPAPMQFRAVYRLEPVPHDQQDDELRTRLATMRAIQGVSTEAASEVEIAFPTTIDCTGGKLRFNANHDTLSLSDLQCYLGRGFLQRFARYSQGALVFKDDWHKIPGAMLFNNSKLWGSFNVLKPWFRTPTPSELRAMEGFMTFLADCTNLRIMGFMHDTPDDYLAYFHQQWLALPAFQHTSRRSCRFAPKMRGSFYDRYWERPSWTIHHFINGVMGLEALVHGLSPGVEATIGSQEMRFGRQELQHLHFLAALPASPQLVSLLRDLFAEKLRRPESAEAQNGGTGSS